MVATFLLVALAASQVSCSCICPPSPCYSLGGASLVGDASLGLNTLGSDDVISSGDSFDVSSSGAFLGCGDNLIGGVSTIGSSIDNSFVDSGSVSDLSAVSQSCTRHRLVPVNRQVVDECIDNVPVVRKSVRQQEETFTRQVPVVEKSVQQQRETSVRHVPVTQKNLRTVVENRVEHVPVVKTRTRTVVEPYTTHVPVTRQSNRQVEETVTRHVPVTETRLRPVVTQRTRLVPVVEKRLKPVVESHVENVPVRKQIVRNIVEQRAVPVQGPCSSCDFDNSFDFNSGVTTLNDDISDFSGVASFGSDVDSCSGNVVLPGSYDDSLIGTPSFDSGISGAISLPGSCGCVCSC